MSTPDGAIVVGLDGSPESERGVDWATGEAAGRGVPLHLLHALLAPLGELPATAAEQRVLLDGAESLLAAAAERARAGGATPVTTEITEKSAAPALIEASERAAAMVVGARGHSAMSGFLLGSVSQHLARHARCPVVVCRDDGGRRVRRVVVGVDGSVGADAAIGFAMEHAARTGAQLVALYGWRDRHPAEFGRGEPDWPGTRERIRAGNRLLDTAVAGWREKYPQVDVSIEAIPEHPARALADASERAALVVVGARGHGGFAGLLLGSVSQSVLTHARCPVAVVR